MQGLCAEKKAIGPRKRFDCSTLQSIADKESGNRGHPSGVAGPRFVLANNHILRNEPNLALPGRASGCTANTRSSGGCRSLHKGILGFGRAATHKSLISWGDEF